MKKLIVTLLCLALCLSFAGCGKKQDDTADTHSSIPSSSQEVSSDSDSSDKETDEEEEYKVNFDGWEMKLINSENFVTAADVPPLATIKSTYAVHPNTRFDARAIGRLHYMLEDAKKAGITLKIETAFKSENDQLEIFNAKVNEVMDSDISLTLKEAEDIAKTMVAFPRTSEHEIGLAVDFAEGGTAFKDTEAYTWLMENCYDYGFIPRYEDKPAHFRYIGIDNAKVIKESGLGFEEYIEKFGP